MPGPLAGIKVVDVTSAAAGPFVAALLGQLGAEVIKIEPPSGDRIHVVLPTQNGRSTTYMAMSVNKRGMILDLKDAQQYAIARDLINACDIFLENYRRGVPERLKLDYPTLSARHPRLIYCTVAGWGDRGPWAKLANIDPYVQATGGFASITGSPDGRAESMRYYGHLDLTASCTAVQAILTALYARHKTGQGQYVQTSLLAANLALQATRIAEYFATGANPPRLGHAVSYHVPHQAFATQTGWIAVAAHTAEEWRYLCMALDLSHLIDDARFASNAARVEHRQKLIPILQERLRHKPALWWLHILGRYRVPCGLFMGYPELRYHQQALANDLIAEVDTPCGRLHVGGLPWQFSRTPCTLEPPTEPGQYTQEIIRHTGRDPATIPGATDERPKFIDIAAQISRPF
jgi:crotonobetainyl-CoA:carnitine CoA-transferase CaiB-like acyl-CoA transferase